MVVLGHELEARSLALGAVPGRAVRPPARYSYPTARTIETPLARRAG
jgi:hypothetical protein